MRVPRMAVAAFKHRAAVSGPQFFQALKPAPARMRLRSAYRRFPGPPEATIGKMRFRAVRPPAPIPEPSIALGTDGLRDSPLEGSGFELPVPRASRAGRHLFTPDHEELIGRGFGPPDLTLAAGELPYASVAVG